MRRRPRHARCSPLTYLSAIGGVLLFVGVGTGMVLLHRGPSPEAIIAGAELFEHEFTVHDPKCGSGDGLGPVFNERSCVACHVVGGVGGAGPNSMNVTVYEVFPVPGRRDVVAGGIHHFATEAHLVESVALLHKSYPPVPAAVQRIDGCAVRASDFDPVQVDEINTPALFGIALLDDMAETSITYHATKRSLRKVSREFRGDFSGAGVGRLRYTDRGKVGRFGWKGQFASVEEFVANACAMELGLTNPKVSQPQPLAGVGDRAAELDLSSQQLFQLTSFVRSLPRPQQVISEDPQLREATRHGEGLFTSIGCADCHVPNIGGVEGVYTDFHLYEVEHDHVANDYVDPDFEPEFTLPANHPRPSEWKTPPLWGVADTAPYFHDGQSPTLIAALRRHGRDARFARDNFLRLDPRDQFALLTFLESLRGPAGESLGSSR